MSYPVTGIPVAGLVELNPGPLLRSPTPAISLPPPEPSAAETQAHIARQNAEPVSAVFRANGKVVAVMRGSGGTMFVSNAGAPPTRELSLDDVASRLAQRYGAALSVERYAPGAGPAYGRIMDEIYGTRSSLLDIRA